LIPGGTPAGDRGQAGLGEPRVHRFFTHPCDNQRS
jgi:hypothetical protein